MIRSLKQALRRVAAAGALVAALGVMPVMPVLAAPADIALPGDRFYPESLSSTADGTLYVGSMAQGVVVRIPAGTHQPETFIPAGSNGLLSVLGVLADEAHDTLWVCSSDLSGLGVVMKAGARPVALKAYDLKTGAPKGSYPLPGERTLCNDATVAKDGTLYVTDSFSPHILRLKPGAKSLEVWVTDKRFAVAQGAGLDGIAIGSDNAVYANLYNGTGLYRVPITEDGSAGVVTMLDGTDELKLSDGLRSIGPNTLLMIEGTGKLVRITVDGGKARIETVRDGFRLPVSVTVTQGVAWVAEGQLNHLFDPKAGPPALPFKVIPVTGFEK